MIQIKTNTNCTLCLNYLLSTLLILRMVYTCDIQMANGYLQRLVWEVNGFLNREKKCYAFK